MKIIISALCVVLAGCAGQVRLLSEGKAYHGTYNTGTKTIDVEVEGRRYVGNYVMGQSFSINQSAGFAQAYSGRHSAYGFGNSFGTTSTRTNQGRALLVSADNRTLRCDIMSSGMEGQGVCQDTDGRFYDLIATMR